MKKNLGLALLILSANVCIAQEKDSSFQLGFGLAPGILVTSGSGSTYSFGVELQGENHFSKQFSGFFSGGLTLLFDSDGHPSAGFVPLQVGPRYYIYKGLFAGVGVGYAILFANDETVGEFNYHPHIGLDVKTTQIILGYNALERNGYTSGFLDLHFVFKL
jgi:hypothetical protein